MTVRMEGFVGICEVLLVLETLEAERKKNHAPLGQTAAGPTLTF